MTAPRGRRLLRRAGTSRTGTSRTGTGRASTGRPLAAAASRPVPTGRVPGTGSRPEQRREVRRPTQGTTTVGTRLRRPRLTGRAVLLGGLVLLLAFTLAGPVRQYAAGRAELAQLTAEGAELDRRYAELEEQRAALDDPTVIAREARARLLYVAAGDRLIQVVDSDDAEGDAGTVPESSDAEPEPWYDTLMGSLAAADDAGER